MTVATQLATAALLGLLLGVTGCSRSAPPDDAFVTTLIGLYHEGEPLNGTPVGGWLVTDAFDSPTYGIADIAFPTGRYLLLDSLSGRRDGHAEWKVVAVMKVPEIRARETLIEGVCRIDGVQEPGIVAIVVVRESENPAWYTNVRRAWRADVTTQRFEELAVRGIECQNEGFGV